MSTKKVARAEKKEISEEDQLCQEAEDIAKTIKESVLHYNNFVLLFDLCDPREAGKVQHTALKEAFSTFEHLITTKREYARAFTLIFPEEDQLKSKKQKLDEKTVILIKFLHEKYCAYIDLLLDRVRSDNTIFRDFAFTLLMRLIKTDNQVKAKIFGKQQDIEENARIFESENKLLKKIIEAITLGNTDTEGEQEVPLLSFSPEFLAKVKSYFHEYEDLRFIMMQHLTDIIKSQYTKKKEDPELNIDRFLLNCFALLHKLPLPPDDEEDMEHRLYYIRNQSDFPILKEANVAKFKQKPNFHQKEEVSHEIGKKRARVDPAEEQAFNHAYEIIRSQLLYLHSIRNHHKQFQAVWFAFLRHKQQPTVYRQILLDMPLHIIPNLISPELLCDFFTDSYNMGGLNSILALQGLFILISKYNLDYPNFYANLYALLQPSIFLVKHSGSFFDLCKNFFASSYLPEYLSAAFCKRLIRLGLGAPPAAFLPVLPLVHNIMLSQPQLAVLLHRVPVIEKNSVLMVATPTTNTGSDQFDMNELNPAKSNAKESSLWEIKALRQHYYPAISRFCKVFEKPMDPYKQPYDIQNFINHTYKTEFDTTISTKRRKEKPVPLTFESSGKFVSDAEHETSFPCWDF